MSRPLEFQWWPDGELSLEAMQALLDEARCELAPGQSLSLSPNPDGSITAVRYHDDEPRERWSR